MRSTRQRDAIAAAVDKTFRSAQEIHATARANGERVGLTTVYRHLQDMAAEGAIDAMRTDDGEAVYRRCVIDMHHHHLVCRSCGRTQEVIGLEVEAWAERMAHRYGFADVSHTVELFGTCRLCR
jgi:Fur family ferric uptake transcriptional regulator